MEKFDVIVIGGGPAGLFCASHLKGKKVLLLERMDGLGKKLLISGKCQCNFTKNEEAAVMMKRYGDKEKFVKNAIRTFDSKKTVKFFAENDVESVVLDNGKIFPKSMKAEDVLNVFVELMKENEVKIQTKAIVRSVKKEENFVVKTENMEYESEVVVITTGGKSYPVTGSHGDGYKFARLLGHKIMDVKPALSPIYCDDKNLHGLAGVSFKEIIINLYRGNKKVSEITGDLLLTHKGLSGPIILDNARSFEVNDILKIKLIDMELKPLSEKVIKYASENGKKTVKGFIREELNLQKAVADMIFGKIFSNDILKMSELSKDKRNELVNTLIAYPVQIKEIGGFNIAMATTGGVSTQEINMKTMKSKLVENLYFAGEVIDVDGNTGGYNIQWAFSSANLAVLDILKK